MISSGTSIRLRVLVACEYSGTVRDAFIKRGHEALSCDLLPTDSPGPHYQGDVREVLDFPWDLMIAHPPCTDLAVSGARHFVAKRIDGRTYRGGAFFMMLSRADIPRIAIENPVCVMSSLHRKPDQIIQPWQFGHGETKATCLWLKGLPNLVPTNIVSGRDARVWRMPPGPNRWKLRSTTFQGIADAMADQWGSITTGRSDTMIRKGDTVKIKPKWQDKGDTLFTWAACDDEDKGRVTIAPLGTGLSIPPRQTVSVDMLDTSK